MLRVAPRSGLRGEYLAAAAMIVALLAIVVGSGVAGRSAPASPAIAAVAQLRSLPGDPPSTTTLINAAGARALAGAQLSENPALILSDDAGPLLASGRVDARLILILGQSLAAAPTRVADFPAGEDDGAGVRHRMLVGTYQGFALTRNESSSPSPEAVAAVTSWMAQLTGVFEPTDIALTDAGLLITLDATEPAGLLPPFTAAQRATS